jgi:uncharacterized protein (DUF2062 family)
MRGWLKRITPAREQLERLWCLRALRNHVIERGCWHFRRASVVRAFALGLVIAFVPPTPLPVHLTLCALLGVAFRLNLPVLVATVFLSNPLTWVPQIAVSVWVGSRLMGLPLMPLIHGLNHHTILTQLGRLWAPLLLGALVMGAIAGALGYLLGQLAWRARVVWQLRERRARARMRCGALRQAPLD